MAKVKVRVKAPTKFGTLRESNFWSAYTLPLLLTGLLCVLVVAAAAVRSYQRNELARLLTQVAVASKDYNGLNSKDKTQAVTRNGSNSLPVAAGQTGNFLVSPGSTSLSSSGSGSTGTPALPQPFSANISSFGQGQVTLECSTQQHNKAKCSKRYSFSAVVSTAHGPGTVQYGWRSNWQAANADGSYVAAYGSSQKTLATSILIPCLSPGSYNLQLVLTTPKQVQSATLNFTHDCAGI